MKTNRTIPILTLLFLAFGARLATGEDDPIVSTIVRWAKAWENAKSDFEAYRSFYDPAFYAGYKSKNGMNYDQWMADKQKKVTKAKCIKVEVGNISYAPEGEDVVRATFDQKYMSDTYCDYGVKTMYLINRSGGWKILGEEQPKVTKCSERCGGGIKVFRGNVKDETIDGLRLGDPVAKVIKKYGDPPQKSGPSDGGQMGGVFFEYLYPEKGLNFNLHSDAGGESGAYIWSIGVSKPGILTGSGIGVGSSFADVKKAYPKGAGDKTGWYVDDGDCSEYLNFALENGIVTGFVLAMPEC